MKLLPCDSHEYRDKKLRAQRLKLIFWQGENALGGVREDVCPIVAKYDEDQIINDMKEAGKCYLINTNALSTNRAAISELFKAEVIIPIRYLLSTKHQSAENHRDGWKFI